MNKIELFAKLDEAYHNHARLVKGKKAFITSDMSPELFEQMVEEAKQYVISCENAYMDSVKQEFIQKLLPKS